MGGFVLPTLYFNSIKEDTNEKWRKNLKINRRWYFRNCKIHYHEKSKGRSNEIRIVKKQSNINIELASYVTNAENYGEITVKSGSILYIKIMET